MRLIIHSAGAASQRGSIQAFMRKLTHIAFLFLSVKGASAAEHAFPPECPKKGNMEVVDNPSEWADQCFKAINGRLPSDDNSGQTGAMDRDIDLDGTPERLEVRGVGNRWALSVAQERYISQESYF